MHYKTRLTNIYLTIQSFSVVPDMS